ncbi:hypothetical protein [Nostoc sp. FACHB-110]|nr:hypothetical protein [Nostoc sp. FACHB-110]
MHNRRSPVCQDERYLREAALTHSTLPKAIADPMMTRLAIAC